MGENGLAACPSKPYTTDYGYTGTAYVFRQFSGKWSQQQKLIAEDSSKYAAEQKIAERCG